MYATCANKVLVKPLDELCKDSNIVAKGKSDAVMQLYKKLHFHRSHLHVIAYELEVLIYYHDVDTKLKQFFYQSLDFRIHRG